MKTCFVFVVLSALFSVFKPTGAFPQPGFGWRGSRRGRDASCRNDLEYPHGSGCCLNCPAGEHVKSPCTTAGTMGTCGECPIGTFTEHANGFRQCFTCSMCRPDEEVVRKCSATQNTDCQCKPGRFCDPDHACEVCKKCSRCGSDEEMVRNCTATTNTECKKIQPKADSATVSAWLIVAVVLPLVALAALTLILIYFYKKRRATTGSQRNLPERMKAEKEDEQFPTLVPVNGEESLRGCFEFFELLDVDHHKRFFRHLGFSDNVIKSKENLLYEDKIHELLNMWIEREGKDASLNELMTALLNLNQKRTAELVKEKAVHHGHYLCES
ncbi:tumor necrosis factor receptor superfamily member 10B-like isoform X3 [Leuresthes tenuis]|uniref:tumor necrosis factor receptor superfamily member 10B-like isoform X3 n=1 Tax=Leuresthes tenuis TaxID=355514 RepID=UPI003B50ECD8